MNARLSVIAACAGVALAVTGCSGGAAPSTQSAAPTTTTAPAADTVKWAGAFCGGTTPVLAGGGELTALVAANAGNPAVIKEGVLKVLDSGSASLAESEKKLKDVGAPAPDFLVQIQKLGAGASGPAKLSAAIAKLDADPKYKDALAKAPECVEMRAKLAKLIGQ